VPYKAQSRQEPALANPEKAALTKLAHCNRTGPLYRVKKRWYSRPRRRRSFKR